MAFDMVIRNGRIIDGSGNPWYRADVGVVDGRIVALGRLPGDALREFDAAGQIVAPGFIDMHTHSDLMVLAEPELPAKIRQGITTEVITQDGKSAAPVNASTRDGWRQALAPVDGNPAVEWTWSGLGEYMEALAKLPPGINLATLVPYGNVRSLVMGFGPGMPSSRQQAEMEALVAAGMEDGAFGISFGLIYQPQMYATRDELTRLCRVVGRYQGMMVVHMRNEGDKLLEAVDEVITICLEAGCALHISHIKAAGRRNWDKAPLLLERLERARSRGLDVTFDQYPYTAASTTLAAILPPWASEGGASKIVARLRDAEVRKRIAWEIEHMVGGDRPTTDPTLQFWENFVASAGWEGISITSVSRPEHRAWEGKTIAALAADLGQAPADVAFDVLIADDCGVTMAAAISSEENVRRFLAHELGTVGSDGILVGKPHPRAYGTFPRVLGRYVREHGVLSLPQMVRRITSLPAQRLGLPDRGLLRMGMKADMVVFNPDTISDTATFEAPRTFPEGISAVVVNGAMAVQEGQLTGVRRGEVLRRTR